MNMLKFNKNVEERKTIAHRLGELTGIQPFYTRAPLYNYEVGPYTVDRAGNLLVDEDQADPEILTALMSEGLITGGEVVGVDVTEDDNGEETGPCEIEETDAAEGDDEPEAEVSESEAPEAEEPAAEEAEPEEPSDEEQISDAAEVSTEDTTESTETAEATAEPNTEGVDMEMNFPLPISRHSGTSLRNLVNLIYSRGSLISKATGGSFSADEDLVEALKDDSCTFSRANFLSMLKDYEEQHGEALHGVKIADEEVIFTGFGKAEDMDTLTAYGQLAVLMNEQALTQKRIQAKHVDDTNEKYAMRIWLLRIGMGGDEFKKTRAILMKKLGGHTAFRTPEEAQKAKEKAQRQCDAQKAARRELLALISDSKKTGAEETDSPVQPDGGAGRPQPIEVVLTQTDEAGA